MTKAKRRELRPVRPSAPIREQYQASMERELAALHRSIVYWVQAQYRARQTELAADASPVRTLRDILRKRGRLWRSKFALAAPRLAGEFAGKTKRHVDRALEGMLKDNGLTVRFRPTRALNNVIQATVGAQVDLITNLAAQHIAQVEGAVMRSAQTGRDLAQLSDDLENIMGVSRRRAELIARHQANLSTAALTRARHLELGITEARWLHSAGGRTPRPEHVAFSGKSYEIAKGAFLEGKWTFPGVEINCRCVSVPILPEQI